MGKKLLESYNKKLLRRLCVRPISYIKALGEITKSANAGLFMSQLLFWWEKGSNPDWIYKTIAEVEEETCLSRHEQDTAIEKWIKLGVLQKKRKGIPQKRYFRIDYDRLEALLSHDISLSESASKFAEQDARVSAFQQTNTEITREIL